MNIRAGGFPPAIFLTAIDIYGILRYTKSVLITIVQLVCHLLKILTENNMKRRRIIEISKALFQYAENISQK